MNGGRTGLHTAVLETTWGTISIDASDRGVVACRLPNAQTQAVPVRVLQVQLPRRANPVLRQAVIFVRAMLAGRASGKRPRLDETVFSEATDFRGAIWKALGRIPRGRTATYSELARQAGSPRAARAAGSACGANPLPLFIPCHRAVGTGDRLGGFSAGLAWKIHLLSGEGARP
jgi:O-6-methylguanine DNA methyltransferase